MDSEDLSRMNKVLRHRLRNFASGIKSSVALLAKELEGKLSPEMMEYFPLITNECDRLGELTSRLNLIFDETPGVRQGDAPSSASARNIARSTAGRPCAGESVSVGKLVASLFGVVRAEFPTADVTHVLSEDTARAEVRPSGPLFTALGEIVKNAVEEGKRNKVIVDCRAENSVLRFRVIDHGRGVAPEDYEKIFLPFYTTKSRHTGIGLTIARKMVTKMAGKVTAAANPKGGLIVEVTVPVCGTAGQ